MVKSNTSVSKLAPLFENIEKLSKVQRIGIYVGVLALLIVASIWFLFRPQYVKIKLLSQQLQTVQAELAKAKRNAQELNDWRNKMKQKQTQYKTVMRALPEKEEIPSLIAGISQAGRDAGLEFLLFQPKPENAKGFYAEIPVDIDVSGTYHQVALFFDKVSNLRRIVNIRNIKMAAASEKDGAGKLKTVCQAVTYKFIEAKPGAQKGRRRHGKK